MSRIGNRIIVVPEGVTVTSEDNNIHVKGPKGELSLALGKGITVNIEGNNVSVLRANDEKTTKAMHGTMNARIHNMIEGVMHGFKKGLELIGVGYRFNVKGTTLVISAGYSHPVEMDPPAVITFDVPDSNHITVRGIDKELVGQTAAEVRKQRPPEVYRGKGIKYADEVIRRKEGKTGK